MVVFLTKFSFLQLGCPQLPFVYDLKRLFIAIKPSEPAPVLPETSLGPSILRYIGALSMLLSTPPEAMISAAIVPHKLAISFSFIKNELSNIFLPIRPDERAFAMHFVIQPVSFVALASSPLVNPKPADFIHLEGAFVPGPIFENKHSFPMLFTLLVRSCVSGAIRPGF